MKQRDPTIANIIVDLLNLQTAGKIFHWQTPSYAAHKASDEMVEELAEKTDEMIEIVQGLTGERLRFSQQSFHYRNMNKSTLLRLIRSATSRLYKLDKLSTTLGSSVLNVRDEIVGILQRTQYLLSFDDVRFPRQKHI